MDVLLQGCRSPVDTDGRAERIHVGQFMTHYKDLVFHGNKLPERLGLDTGFDTGILGCLLPSAAIVGDPVAVLDHGLVAASCKSQVNGYPGIVITLRIGHGA